jgi:hypothetical protein
MKADSLATYLAAGGSPEHEGAVLSVGRALLPECARHVLSGLVPEPEYWAWLTEQLELPEEA